MNHLHPTACDFVAYKKAINFFFKTCLPSMQNQLQDLTPNLFSYQLSCHHPLRYFFEGPPV